MDEIQVFLAHIWFVIIGLILALYVILDGFDLGVGVLSSVACDERRRGIMMASLGSVWDANETWLVLLGGALFGAFPVVYGILLHGLYIPIMLMLFALIFRGVAFEFREHSRNKTPWNIGFSAGSLVAALAQGLMLGALIEGLTVTDGRYAGGVWDWLSPFAIVVAVGVVAGYSLLGATYLIMKTEGEIQQRSVHRAYVSAAIMLVAAVVVTIWTPLTYPYVAEKWFRLPTFFYIGLLPGFAGFSYLMLLRALRRGFEMAPFLWTLSIFVCSFAGLAVSLFPYIVPPSITISEAAASSKTLIFMLTGIGMLIPIMLVYNGYQYLVFRGKVRSGEYGGGETSTGTGDT